MVESFRRFEAGPDAFGRTWEVEFVWIQNAISIRHADAVDVKFRVGCGDEATEKIIALPHPDLLSVAAANHREVTDAWCSRLAAVHLTRMIETGGDMEKTLVTVPRPDLESHAARLAAAVRA